MKYQRYSSFCLYYLHVSNHCFENHRCMYLKRFTYQSVYRHYDKIPKSRCMIMRTRSKISIIKFQKSNSSKTTSIHITITKYNNSRSIQLKNYKVSKHSQCKMSQYVKVAKCTNKSSGRKDMSYTSMQTTYQNCVSNGKKKICLIRARLSLHSRRKINTRLVPMA